MGRVKGAGDKQPRSTRNYRGKRNAALPDLPPAFLVSFNRRFAELIYNTVAKRQGGRYPTEKEVKDWVMGLVTEATTKPDPPDEIGGDENEMFIF